MAYAINISIYTFSVFLLLFRVVIVVWFLSFSKRSFDVHVRQKSIANNVVPSFSHFQWVCLCSWCFSCYFFSLFARLCVLANLFGWLLFATISIYRFVCNCLNIPSHLKSRRSAKVSSMSDIVLGMCQICRRCFLFRRENRERERKSEKVVLMLIFISTIAKFGNWILLLYFAYRQFTNVHNWNDRMLLLNVSNVNALSAW